MRLLILLTPLILLPGCGAQSDMPQVAERYQEGLERAWERADRGEIPTNQCASLTGRAVGARNTGADRNGEAEQAYVACYVDVHAHWIRTRLAQAEPEQPPCLPLMTGMVTTRMSLGTFASEFDLTIEELDARLNRAIGDQVRQSCPDHEELILGRSD